MLHKLAPSFRFIVPTIGLGYYFLLLGALAIVFLVAPLLATVNFWGIRLSDVLSSSLLLVGVLAVRHSRIAVVGLSILALVTIVAQVVNYYTDFSWMVLVANTSAGLFLVGLFVVIVVDLFRTSAVTGATLAAACCGYILIAGIFAAGFSVMIALDPKALSLWEGADVTADQLIFQEGRFGVLGYFSLVTLTTLGYGDIVPNTDYARSVAVTEAVIGQLYLAVIVARLVGMYIAGRSGKHKAQYRFD